MTDYKAKPGDFIVWKNKNTNTTDEGFIRSDFKDMFAIGDHFVSWLLKDDVEIIEIVKNNH